MFWYSNYLVTYSSETGFPKRISTVLYYKCYRNLREHVSHTDDTVQHPADCNLDPWSSNQFSEAKFD